MDGVAVAVVICTMYEKIFIDLHNDHKTHLFSKLCPILLGTIRIWNITNFIDKYQRITTKTFPIYTYLRSYIV